MPQSLRIFRMPEVQKLNVVFVHPCKLSICSSKDISITNSFQNMLVDAGNSEQLTGWGLPYRTGTAQVFDQVAGYDETDTLHHTQCQDRSFFFLWKLEHPLSESTVQCGVLQTSEIFLFSGSAEKPTSCRKLLTVILPSNP